MPVADTRSEGYVDRWIVYGKVRRRAALHRQGTDRRTRREGTIKDNGAYGLICVQGTGKINGSRSTARR